MRKMIPPVGALRVAPAVPGKAPKKRGTLLATQAAVIAINGVNQNSQN
jgi:hypothetical protein